MRPTIHHRLLGYLDDVARLGSIRAASERQNVAASAISRQIRALEDALGTPLFDRTGQRLVLTAAGELLVRHVRDTLSGYDRTVAMIEDLKGLRKGRVTIGLMSGLAANLIPDAVAQFRRSSPRVDIGLQLMTTGEAIVAAVGAGEVDLGVGFDLLVTPGVRLEGVVQARLGAVMAPDHPLAGKPVLRFSDCLQHPMVLADPSTVIRPYLDQMIARVGTAPRSVVDTNSIEIMRRLAVTDGFITFLTPFDIAHEIRRGSLVHIPVRELQARGQELCIVSRARNASALAGAMAEHLRGFIGSTVET